MTGNLYKVSYVLTDEPLVKKWWTNFGWTYQAKEAVCMSHAEAVRVVGRQEGLSPTRIAIEPVLVGKPPRSLISVKVQDLVMVQLRQVWSGETGEVASTVEATECCRSLGSEMASVQWDDLVSRLPVEFRHLLDGKNPFGEMV